MTCCLFCSVFTSHCLCVYMHVIDKPQFSGRWRVLWRSLRRLHAETSSCVKQSAGVLQGRSLLRQPCRHSSRPDVRGGWQHRRPSPSYKRPPAAAAALRRTAVIGGVAKDRADTGPGRGAVAPSAVRAFVAGRSNGIVHLRPTLRLSLDLSLTPSLVRLWSPQISWHSSTTCIHPSAECDVFHLSPTCSSVWSASRLHCWRCLD